MKGAKGFSLVEIMIAVGSIGAIALVLMQMQKNAVKTSAEFEGKMDVTTTQNEIQQILSNPENCQQTFQGKNAVNTTNAVSAIKFKNSAGAFVDRYQTTSSDPNAKYGSGKLKIEDYTLSDAATEVAVVGQDTTHLLVRFDKGNMAGADSVKKITLKVVVDGSSNIISCVAFTNASDIWSRSTTNSSKIFYSAGSVGVGTSDPGVSLDVVGVTRSNEVSFVPIATPSGATCSATEEGKQRYNSTIKNMEFCNGVIWKIFGEKLPSSVCFVKLKGVACPIGWNETQLYFKYRADRYDPTCDQNPGGVPGDTRCDYDGANWRTALYGCCN